MAADALSDLLRTVRLTGAVFFNLDVSDYWHYSNHARAKH
jgi:hypothetical protein